MKPILHKRGPFELEALLNAVFLLLIVIALMITLVLPKLLLR